MSGLFTSAPIALRSMNWSGLPSLGLIVTPLRFQSSGIPSQVVELQSTVKVTGSKLLAPPVWLAR